MERNKSSEILFSIFIDLCLADRLNTLTQSGALSNLREQLPQALSQLGINTTNIEDLQQERGANLQSLIQKLQNLTSSRGT